MEHACTVNKSELEQCQVRIKHLELACEHNGTLIERCHEQKQKDDDDAMATTKTSVLHNGYCAFVTRFKLNSAELARSANVQVDDRYRQMRDKQVNEQYEAKLAQLAQAIGDIGQKCVNRMNRINILDHVLLLPAFVLSDVSQKLLLS